ncbi:hypothetical protein ACQKNX_06960 [Lysinibacillus sp. NPDC093712]|uniref:hypothetical protein n=1 Tax=Lysinibacillus sp. NPDC093712 TaxID=3390579 RepID=UPI003CFE9CCD
MSDVNLSTFPSNKNAALTMLYLEKQDISNLTPSQLVDKYDEVYNEITQRMKENKKGKKISF